MRGLTPRLLSLLLLCLALYPEISTAGLRDIQPRPHQAGLLSSVPVRFAGAPYLVIPENPTNDELLVRDDAVQQIALKTGLMPTVIYRTDYTNEEPAILLGTLARFPELAAALDSTGIAGLGEMTHAEEYQLVVQSGRAVIAGADLRGLRWGMMTLMAVTSSVQGQIYIDQAYVRDWPDFQKRTATANVTARTQDDTNYGSSVIDISYAYRMNEVECNFNDAGHRNAYPTTISNMRYLTGLIRNHGMTLTMGADNTAMSVDSMWYQEGIPIHSTMLVTASGFTPVLFADPVPMLNPGFESWTANRPNNWDMYRDDRFAFVSRDSVVKHSGSASVKFSGFSPTTPSGVDIRQAFYLPPNHFFNFKFWYKTSGYQGSVFVDVQSKNAPWNRWNNASFGFSTPTSNDWTQFELPLCTFASDTVLFLIGPTGPQAGTLWLDDLTFETADFQNMVRRSDTPVNVYKQNQTIPLTEGTDYQITELSSTPYTRFITTPKLNRIAGGALNVGDTVHVDWSCAFMYQGVRRTQCFSLIDPLLDYQDRVAIVDSMFHPDMYKIHINEVSYADYDSLCISRHLTPAQLVGRYCQQMYQIIQGRRPGIPVRIYGDAFDILVLDTRAMPVQTAPWTVGSLQELSPQIEMMDMTDYSRNLDSTMIYFESNGHPSILGYPELGHPTMVGYVEATQAAKRHPASCKGTICYTWQGDCNLATLRQQLPITGELSWNMGPYILHDPPAFHSRPDSIVLRAEMWTDRFWSGDSATLRTAALSYRYLPSGNWTTVPITSVGADIFGTTLRNIPPAAAGLSYYLSVADSRGDTTMSPADAPTRAFTAMFGSGTPPAGGRAGDEIDFTSRTVPGGLLIEWANRPDTKWYEVHAGANADFSENSRTLVARQSPECPRFLARPDRVRIEETADLHVYRFAEESARKRRAAAIQKR